MHASVAFWPYLSLPSLRTVWRKSHVAEWLLNVPPPAFVVYVCINLHTGSLYIRQTSQAPIQRLHTDTRANTDNATFHHMLLTTNIADWVTIPMQYCPTLFQTGPAERTRWSDLKQWAVNDIPPGISDNDTRDSKWAYMHNTILHMLHELRHAQQQRDGQLVKALQALLREHTQKVSPRFHVSGTIVVPNLRTIQKATPTNIVRKILRTNTVRTVRSNPQPTYRPLHFSVPGYGLEPPHVTPPPVSVPSSGKWWPSTVQLSPSMGIVP